MEVPIIAAVIGVIGGLAIAYYNNRVAHRREKAAEFRERRPNPDHFRKLYRETSDAIEVFREGMVRGVLTLGREQHPGFDHAGDQLVEAAKEVRLVAPQPVNDALMQVLQASQRLIDAARAMGGRPSAENSEWVSALDAYDNANANYIRTIRRELGADGL